MKIFAGERLNAIMVRLKMPEGEAIEHRDGDALAESRSARSSSATSTSASSCSSTTTSPTTSARSSTSSATSCSRARTSPTPSRAMRQGVLTSSAATCRSTVSRSNGSWRARAGALAECQLKLAVAAGDGRAQPDDEAILERVVQAGEERLRRQDRDGRPGGLAHQFERNVMLQSLDTTGASTCGARPPAPGHPPARLCAEEPQAGIQARGL